MVRVQLLTGMRAGEVMVMRGIDLNTGRAVWTYRPRKHKNQHRELDRIIHLGPQAQEVVKPFLRPNVEEYLFSPKAYVEELRARRAAQRKTKRTPSEKNRKRKANPKRQPAERYNRRSYRSAASGVRAARRWLGFWPRSRRQSLATLPHPLRRARTPRALNGSVNVARNALERSWKKSACNRTPTPLVTGQRRMGDPREDQGNRTGYLWG